MLSDWKSAYLWRSFLSLSLLSFLLPCNKWIHKQAYIETDMCDYKMMIWLHFLPPLKREHGGSEIDGKAVVIYAAKLLIKIHPLFRISFHPYDTLKGSLNANRRRHNGIKEGLKHPHLTERWFLWVVESERGAKKGIFHHTHDDADDDDDECETLFSHSKSHYLWKFPLYFYFCSSNMFTNNLLDACFSSNPPSTSSFSWKE